MLHILDAVLLAVELILAGHGKLLGGNKVECGVEMAHGHDERVHGAPVFQVAYKENVEVVESSLGLVDGIQVEHTLRWVLVCAVARIDDGHRGYFAGVLCCTLDVVAHDNGVGIV